MKKVNILICPLEWGLGHASRMVPLAVRLTQLNQNVIIASGEEHLSFFRKELPGLTYLHFPGFRPAYSRYLPQFIPVLLSAPVLIYHIIKEHLGLKKIIRDFSVDMVISDNRFGLWNKRVKCVYITHMPLIPFPRPFRFLESAGIFLHRIIIRKYTHCFIPDLPGDLNLTGRLSHGIKLPENTRFTGILSRFPSTSGPYNNPFRTGHNTVILSGPEPQKGVFRQLIIGLLKDREELTVVFEGKVSHEGDIENLGNMTFVSHPGSSFMQEVIGSSGLIIARSGYSTVMDLVSLGRSAILIPTPGQTEQEYLARYLSSKGWFSSCPQHKLTKGAVLATVSASIPPDIREESSALLDKALGVLLD